MSHPIQLEIPDEIYEPLRSRAEQSGQTPEELILEWLAATVQQPTQDPLLQLAGAFEYDRADVSERHDEYLGKGLARELREGSNG